MWQVERARSSPSRARIMPALASYCEPTTSASFGRRIVISENELTIARSAISCPALRIVVAHLNVTVTQPLSIGHRYATEIGQRTLRAVAQRRATGDQEAAEDGSKNSSSWMLSGSRKTSAAASGIEFAVATGENVTPASENRCAHVSRSSRLDTANDRWSRPIARLVESFAVAVLMLCESEPRSQAVVPQRTLSGGHHRARCTRPRDESRAHLGTRRRWHRHRAPSGRGGECR